MTTPPPIWGLTSPPPWPASETPSGNGGSHGDLRERVRALEVQSHMHHTSTVERLRAQVDRMVGIDRRLEQGDQRMSGLQQRITGLDDATRRHGEAITPIASKVDDLAKWREAQDADQRARVQSKEDRRAARKEAFALIQWAAALVLMVAYALGAIGVDKIEGLVKLRGLVP